ncbi:MAG TPA: porin [Paracoccaceae bacterium]|nr:porin [Paracoccaceae bacterium]
MKHLLTTAAMLAASASVAAAEVAVSGNGRMGVVYNGEDLNFSSRIRVAFTLSGETDGGLTFGGSFRADNAGGAANGSAGEIFVSGAFGTTAMGDVVGAAEAVIGDLPEVGFTDLSSDVLTYGVFENGLALGQNDIAYLTGDSSTTAAGNPVLLYTYTAGNLTVALSFNDGNGPNVADSTNEIIFDTPDTQEFALGLRYDLGDYGVALGYEVADPSVATTAKHIIVAVDATFGATEVKAFYGRASGAALLAGESVAQYGVGVTSTFDALTVKGYVKQWDDPIGGDVMSYGVGAEYSLGGGATVAGGIVDNDLAGTDPRADLGIKFTF